MKIDNTKAQMRKGILEYCILGILDSSDAYASDIIDQLKEAKLIVVEGTLYPLLTRLKIRKKCFGKKYMSTLLKIEKKQKMH